MEWISFYELYNLISMNINNFIKSSIQICNAHFCILFLILGLNACKKDEARGERLEQSMGLETVDTTLRIGDEATIKPKFAPGITPKRTYEWTSDNPDIVSVVTNKDYSATITAVSEGDAQLTIASTDGVLSKMCNVQVMDGNVDVLISFGSGTNGAFTDGWNHLYDFLEGSTIANLKNKQGNSTNIALTVMQRFNQRGNNGEKETETDLAMPEQVSSTLFLGNSWAKYPANGIITEQGVLKLTDLNVLETYDFCFFGSRADYTDNRSAVYTVTGANEGKSALNASGNEANIACVAGIKPNSDGEITITIAADENNSSVQGFYYINAMRFFLSKD